MLNYLDLAKQARAARTRQGTRRNEALPSRSSEVETILDLTSWIYEIRVSFLDDTLFFVLSEQEVSLLHNEGISRGRIWTLRELTDLHPAPSRTWLTVAKVKAMFGGDVMDVRRERSEESHSVNPCGEESEESEKGGQGSE